MKNFLNKIKNDRISEYSAESTYFIVLSIIPFALIFITLIQYINIDKEVLIYYAKEIIPSGFQELSLSIIEEIYSKSLTTISISIVFTIWSASRGFFSIIKGINRIYQVENKSYIYSKIRAFSFTILFITLLALILVIMIFGNYKVILSLVIFIISLLFYKFVPNCKLKLKNQIGGAIFATMSWYVLSYGLSLYIEINRGFSILYGSLTTIVLFMIWVYYLIYAIFIGAEINSYFKG